jgi:lambda repressor-like predicted transcriptional regulator
MIKKITIWRHPHMGIVAEIKENGTSVRHTNIEAKTLKLKIDKMYKDKEDD